MKKFVTLMTFFLFINQPVMSHCLPEQNDQQNRNDKVGVRLKTTLSQHFPKSRPTLVWRLENLATRQVFKSKGRKIYIRLKPDTYRVSVVFSNKTYKRTIIVKEPLQDTLIQRFTFPISAGRLSIDLGCANQQPFFQKTHLGCEDHGAEITVKNHQHSIIASSKSTSLNEVLPVGRYVVQLKSKDNFRTHFIVIIKPNQTTKHRINVSPRFFEIDQIEAI